MHKYIFILLCLFLTSCKSKIKETSITIANSSQAEKLSVLPDTIDISEEHFPRKNAPLNIFDKREKANYEALHFWDLVDFSNIELIKSDRKKFDNSFINFLGLLNTLDNEVAKKAVLIPLQKSNGDILRYILSSYYQYLYRYNSPFTNHLVYEKILSWSVKNPKLRIAEQQQANKLLSIISKNKVGSKAENFAYTSPDEITRLLNKSLSKYVLLIFYSPSCGVCQKEAIEIGQNTKLEALARKNQLEIIFVYPGSDDKLWRENLDIFPTFAKVGIASEDIVSKGIYDIQSWPTIYLLNSKSEVVLRDCSLKEALNKILSNNFSSESNNELSANMSTHQFADLQ